MAAVSVLAALMPVEWTNKSSTRGTQMRKMIYSTRKSAIVVLVASLIDERRQSANTRAQDIQITWGGYGDLLVPCVTSERQLLSLGCSTVLYMVGDSLYFITLIIGWFRNKMATLRDIDAAPRFNIIWQPSRLVRHMVYLRFHIL